MTLISVIIPVYNVENYVGQCLQSVLQQTHKELEIICVDDASTDGSLAVLKDYAARDERIKIISDGENVGSALARNKGLDIAHGEYVYFMDSDDWIEPDYIAKMLAAIEQAGTDIVLNLNILQELPHGTQLYVHPAMKSVAAGGEYIGKYNIIANSPVLLWARLYKRDFLEKNHLRLSSMRTTCDDFIFHYTSNLYAEQTYVFFGPVYHYRVHQASITGQAKTNKCWDIQFIKAYDAIYDYYAAHGFLENCPIKLLNLMSFFMVDTAEKFAVYHAYFAKVLPYLERHTDLYNDMELYTARVLAAAATYEEYRAKHIANLAVDFLRSNKK